MRPSLASRARPWMTGTLIAVALFWIADLALLRAGTPDPLDDTWEYGVNARHLLAGDGFRTGVIHPPLWSLRDPVSGTVPVLVHGPLLPLLLAPAIALLGDVVLDHLAWLSALFAWLTALLLVRLGARHVSPAVGAGAALLWTVAPHTMRAVHHDLALTAGALTLTLALDLLARERPRGIAAGLALGAGVLVRPEFLPALALMLPLMRRGAWRVTLPVALAVWAPWGWHTWRAAGSPFFNLSSYLLIGYWGSRPGIGVLRDFGIPPALWTETLRAALPTLPPKWIDAFPHAMKRALMCPTGGTGWLALIGLAVGVVGARTRQLAAVALALACIPVAIMTLTLYDTRYLVPFLPLWALAAAWGASSASALLPKWARRPRAWLGLIVLLVLPTVAPELRSAATEARALRGEIARMRAVLEPLRVGPGLDGERQPPLFSDRPDFAAWSTGRAVVWLTPAEYERLPRTDSTEAGMPRRPSPAMPSREDGVAVWLGLENSR